MNQKLNDFISWTGLLGTILSIFSVFTSYIEFKQTIFVTILMVLLFSLIYGVIELRKLKKNKSKIYNRFRWIIGLSMAAFIFLTILVLVNIFIKPKVPCTFRDKQIGIVIGNFGSDDNFSFLVHEFLKEEDIEDSIYNLKRINHNYMATIDDSNFKKEMDSLCMTSGILVTGKIDVTDRLFFAKIRFHNFTRRKDSLSLDNNVFAIRNPNMDEFSIDNKAQVLSDFIAALVLYEQHKTERAMALFNKCVKENLNPKNNMFLSSCHTYMGNLLVESKPEKAITHYQAALAQNAQNSEALANMITSLVISKEFDKALGFYEQYPNMNDDWAQQIKHTIDSAVSLKEKVPPKLILPDSKPANPSSSDVQKLMSSGILNYIDKKGNEQKIRYSEITAYTSKSGMTFYIFKAEGSHEKRPYGLIGPNGELISLPKFATLKDAFSKGASFRIEDFE